jgi:cell division protein ZapA
MKQIEATILGQGYVLACPPDGETLLREAVAIVDREMSAIRDAGKVKARERIAVLTALNLAYQQAEQARTPPPLPPAPPAPPTPSAPAVDPGEAAEIERLIRRVDAAIGDDGHLL